MSEAMEDRRARVARDIVLAIEAFGNRYFNFEEEDAAHLEPAVLQARTRYSELKSQGKSFTTCARVAQAEMVLALSTPLSSLALGGEEE